MRRLRVTSQCDTLTAMDTMSTLLTTPEVANLLRKSPRTVQRMANDGSLDPVKKLSGPNGAFLFDAADVRRLASLLGQEVPA